MADKKADELLENMKNAQDALLEENRQKYQAEKDKLAAQADANAAAEKAGGSADYQNFISPNYNGSSIQADALSRLGLNKGVLSQSNQAGGYNAYRSRLAAAARQAQGSKDQLELSQNLYNAQTEAAKSNAEAGYNAMKNSDYWKQANWDYQLAADKKAEEEAKKIMTVSTTSTDPDWHDKVQILYDQIEAIKKRNNAPYKETKPYSKAAIEAENNIKNMVNVDATEKGYNINLARYLWEAGQNGASQDELNYLNKRYQYGNL